MSTNLRVDLYPKNTVKKVEVAGTCSSYREKENGLTSDLGILEGEEREKESGRPRENWAYIQQERPRKFGNVTEGS